MKLIIQTQFEENYGAHDWDGKGACPQYWKMKGGDEYAVFVSLEQAQKGRAELQKIVDAAMKQIEKNSDYCREYLFDWELLGDTEPSPRQCEFADCPEYKPLVTTIILPE